MGHFIVTVLVVYGRAASVSAGLSASASSASVASATSSLTAAVAISFIAFAVQLGGLILGGTLLFNQLNLFHAVAHFFGGVLTAWFVIGGWGYLSYWCAVRDPFHSRTEQAALTASPSPQTPGLL